jgi:hypothetical protein
MYGSRFGWGGGFGGYGYGGYPRGYLAAGLGYPYQGFAGYPGWGYGYGYPGLGYGGYGYGYPYL